MNIINYLPEILLAMFLTFNAAFFVRLIIEGADAKIAFLSLFRFYFLPIVVLLIVSSAYKNRRNILYKFKKDVKPPDEALKKMESILNSQIKMSVLFIRMGIHLYRNIIDVFIKSSISYEKQKIIKKKNKKNKKFFEYFLQDVNYEEHLFHGI